MARVIIYNLSGMEQTMTKVRVQELSELDRDCVVMIMG